MDCSTPGFPVLHHLPSLLKLMSIESVMPSNHLILCHLLLLLPSIFPSINLFQWVSSMHQVAKELALQLPHQSVLPMNILDWFPLGLTGLISLLSKGLKSLPQHHSSKASTLQRSVFFMVQLSHPYTTTGKTSSFWLDRPLLAKWCLYFLIHSIGFSELFFQGASIF